MRKAIATSMSLVLMLTLLMGVFSVSAEDLPFPPPSEPTQTQVIFDDYFNFSSATVGDGVNVGGTNYLTLNINSTATVQGARLRIYSVRYIPPYNSCNMPMGRYIPDGTTRLSHEIGNFFDLYQAIPHLAANVRIDLAEGANSLTVRLNQILTHNMPTTIEIELPEGALATVSLSGTPVATKVIPGIDWELLDSITPNPTGPNNLLPVVPESLRVRGDAPDFSLWREYEDFFQIGNINGSFGTVWARRHYNTWTAENAHKPDNLVAANGTFNFITNPNHTSNNLMRNAMSIDAEVVGHVLVWHGQSRNAFHPGVGATRAQSIAALEHHIRNVVEHFDTFVFPEESPRAGERVMAAWDVVNEAFINEIPYVSEESLNTPGSWKNYLRKVTQPIRGWNNAPGAGTGTVGYAYRYHWYEGFGNGANAELGESGADFIYYAFVIARRYTDAQLIYNDFNLYEEGKAQMVAQMVNELNARYAYEQPNGPDDRKLIEAVGMQGHWYIQDTPVRDPQRGVQRGIDILRETGVRIHITELDLFVYYPYSGSGAGSHGSHTRLKNRTGVQLENPARPYYDHYYWRDRFGLPRDVMPPAGFGKFMEAAQAEMYAEIFATLKANADVVDRVTFWGLRDTNSWRQSHAPLLWYADSPAGVPNPKLSYYAVAFPEEFLGIEPIPTPAQRDDFLQYIEEAVAYLASLTQREFTRESWDAAVAAIEEAREVHEYRWNGVPTLLAAAEAVTDALAGLEREELPPGAVRPVWDTSRDPVIQALPDGATPTSVGPLSVYGGAGINVVKDVDVYDIYGWVDWTSHTVLDVSRPAGGAALRIDPLALGLIPGETYTWLIEGQRINAEGLPAGTHRAAFGSVNAAGETTIIGNPATMIGNANAAVPGYFTIRVSFVHSADTIAYSIYGVGGNNLIPTAGNLRIFNISVVERQEPAVVYFNDFSDGTPGGVVVGVESQHIFEVIESEASQSGGKVLHISRQAGSGYAGFNLLRPAIDERATADIPSGAIIRATVSMRLAPGSPPQLEPLNFRLVSGTEGAVVDWHAGQNLATLTNEFQAFPATATMPPGISVFGVQLCMDNAGWFGYIEVDWIKIEIVEAPEDTSPARWEPNESLPSLWESYAEFFTIGNILDRVPGEALEAHFLYQYNSITMENAMKPVYMSNQQGVYTFEIADSVMDWANYHGIETVGHCLAWHAQSADWLTRNPDGSPVTHAEARANLYEFITTVAGHFAGRVDHWDVLNELFHSGGGPAHLRWWENIRTNAINGHPWRAAYANQTMEGSNDWDFVYDMFVFARKADPNSTLIYNDYNSATVRKATNIADMTNNINAIWATDEENNPEADASLGTPGVGNTPAEWRANDVAIVEAYIESGGRLLIEVLGLQSHNGVNTRVWDDPGLTRDSLFNAKAEYLKAAGVRLHITEMDIGAGGVNNHNPIGQRNAYLNMFQLYMDNAHVIERVTLWGLNDVQSWITTNATLFGRPTLRTNVFRAKPFFVDLAEQGLNYVPRALTATFADGTSKMTAAQGEEITITINLGATGGLVLDGPSTNPADFRLNGLPNTMSIVEANANSITLTGTLPPGTHEFHPWVRKNSVITGSDFDLNRIAGDWVGVRLAHPLVIEVAEGNTMTFHLYTPNQRILDTFAAYTTDAAGRAVIVVPVIPGTAPALGDVLNIGNIYGTEAQHGYAFWGWFDDEMLDAAGRMRAGLRRPALTLGGECPCLLVDLLAQIENATAAEVSALFDGGNIDLYGVWVRWGDVDDNGVVNMHDLNLLQRHINFGHLMPVYFSGAAADVVVDGVINMLDLNLLQRHTNLGHIMPVILGEQPDPPFTVSGTLMGEPVDLTEGLDMVIQMWADLTASHEVVWSICDPAIATIDEDGRVVAVGANLGNVGFHFTMRNPAAFPYMANLDEIRHDNFADGWRQYNPTVRDFDGNAVITATRVSDGAVIEIPVVTTTATRGHLNYAEPLKDTFADHFLIGTIVDPAGATTNIGANHRRHFNILTYQNHMKPNQTGPESALDVNTGIYTMPAAQATALENRVRWVMEDPGNFYLLGHTMFWHNQHARWSSTIQLQTVYNNFANVVRNDPEFVGTAEEREAAARAAGTQAVVSVMNQYAEQYAGRPGIRGNIRSWDVINELFVDDNEFATPAYAAAASWQQAVRQNVRNLPPNTAYEFAYLDVSPMSHWEANGGAVPAGLNGNLNNPWARVLGPEDMVFYAFLSVRRADPYAILKYNDFNTSLPNKQRWIFDMITYINDRYANSEYKLEMMELHGESYGPADRKLIEGLGLQEHINMAQHLTGPVQSLIGQFEFFRPLGINLWVTELDIECLTSAQRNNMPPLVPQPGYPGNQAANFRSYAGIIRQAEFYYHMFRTYLANSDILEQVTWWGLTGSWRNAGDPLPWHTQGGAAGPHNGALKPAWFGIMRALEAHEAGRPHILPPYAVIDNWPGN